MNTTTKGETMNDQTTPELHPDDLFPIDLDAVDTELREQLAITLARIGWHEDRLAAHSAHFAPEIARLNARIEELLQRERTAGQQHETSLAWHRERLAGIVGALSRRDAKTRTWATWAGVVTTRVSKTARAALVDRDAFQAWAETNHAEALGTKYNTAGVKLLDLVGATVTDTAVVDTVSGEVIPGVVTVPAGTLTFTVAADHLNIDAPAEQQAA